MYDVNYIANFFLSKASMTPKKLQKLLYYAYSWVLTILNDDVKNLNKKLFNDRIEAWVHGPVIPSMYGYYKKYGWDEIPKVEKFDKSKLSPDVLNVLEQVWDVYGEYSANQLEIITHNEKPWIEARGDVAAWESTTNKISDETIFNFYTEQAENE